MPKFKKNDIVRIGPGLNVDVVPMTYFYSTGTVVNVYDHSHTDGDDLYEIKLHDKKESVHYREQFLHIVINPIAIWMKINEH